MKKKWINNIIVSAVLIALVGCTTSSTFRPWQLKQIKSGMDKTQVITLLGDPNEVLLEGDKEMLVYTYSDGKVDEFKQAEIMNSSSMGGSVIKEREAEKMLTPDSYIVTLEKGAVVSAEKKK